MESKLSNPALFKQHVAAMIECKVARKSLKPPKLSMESAPVLPRTRVKVSKAATRDAASDAAEGWPYGMLKSGEIGWRLRTGSSPTQRLLI